MPELSGVCEGCGETFVTLSSHQAQRGCFPKYVTATEAWEALTTAVRVGAPARVVASADRQFTESLARYR